jgi:hypothetical protein
MTAHLGFHEMDPAEVPHLCNPPQERADGEVLSRFRMTHLEGDNIPKVFGRKIRAVHGSAVIHERDEPAQDICPVLPDPDVHVCGGRCYPGAEDPAAESTLLTGLVIHCRVVHTVSPLLFIRHPIKVCIGLFCASRVPERII